MALSETVRRMPPLRVFTMAATLVFAAFLGATMGLVWQSSGLGEPDEETAQEEVAQEAEAEEPAPAPTPVTATRRPTIPQSG